MWRPKRKWWFTLLETLIVVAIVGILLWITLGIGSTYLKNVKYRYEKEQFIGFMDKMITTVRTSNYRENATYTYLSIELTSGWVQAFVDSGVVAIDSVSLNQSSLVISWGSSTIRLFPYNIACAEWSSYQEVNDVIYVEDPIIISFSQEAAYTDLETCYQLDLRLCKLQQLPCSG